MCAAVETTASDSLLDTVEAAIDIVMSGKTGVAADHALTDFHQLIANDIHFHPDALQKDDHPEDERRSSKPDQIDHFHGILLGMNFLNDGKHGHPFTVATTRPPLYIVVNHIADVFR